MPRGVRGSGLRKQSHRKTLGRGREVTGQGVWARPGATHHVVFSLENLMPGTRPMRRTIMCRQLLLVSSRTALPIVVLSRLSPFTSVILSPTHRPARSAQEQGRVNPRSGIHMSVNSALGSVPESTQQEWDLPPISPRPLSRDDSYPRTPSFCYSLKREAHPKPRSPSEGPCSPALLPSSTLLTKMPKPCSEPPLTLKPSLPEGLFSTRTAWMMSLSSLLAVRITTQE